MVNRDCRPCNVIFRGGITGDGGGVSEAGYFDLTAGEAPADGERYINWNSLQRSSLCRISE